MSIQELVSDRTAANRRLFLGIYSGLALLSALVYLSQVNVSFVAIAASRLGVAPYTLPAILPYLLSGPFAWKLISGRRLGLYLFFAAATIGTAVANLVIVGTFDIVLNGETIFWYVLAQTGAYAWAAEFLLRIEWP